MNVQQKLKKVRIIKAKKKNSDVEFFRFFLVHSVMLLYVKILLCHAPRKKCFQFLQERLSWERY